MAKESFNLEISDAAEFDILEGFLWYQEQKPGLGDKFLVALDESFIKIVTHPKYYHSVRTGVRAYTIKRFPYSVIYHVKSGTVEVLAVFHKYRNPSDWHNRVNED